MPTPQQIHNRFTYHAASPKTRRLHELVSDSCEAMALQVTNTCEESREQAMALTAMEEVRMRWNQAVAMDGQGFSLMER